MKLEEARISILVGAESTTIEIKDAKASTTFVKVTLTPEQLSECLSRTKYIECEAEVFGLDKIGKTHENINFVFEIPKELASSGNALQLNDLAEKSLKEQGMDEWKPDVYYGSQTSFYQNEGKQFARVTIRRWL